MAYVLSMAFVTVDHKIGIVYLSLQSFYCVLLNYNLLLLHYNKFNHQNINGKRCKNYKMVFHNSFLHIELINSKTFKRCA